DDQRRIALEARADEEAAKLRAMQSADKEAAAKQAAMTAFESEKVAKAAASQRSHLALRAFDLIVQEVQDQLEDRAGTEVGRERLLRRAQDGLRELLAAAADDKLPADHTCYTAFARMGDLRTALGDTRAALVEYDKAIGYARQMVRDNPDDPQYQG